MTLSIANRPHLFSEIYQNCHKQKVLWYSQPFTHKRISIKLDNMKKNRHSLKGIQNSTFYDICLFGNTKIIKFYIDTNDDLDGGLEGACQGGHIKVIKYLCLLGKGVYDNWHEPFVHACSGGHNKIIKFLVKHGEFKIGCDKLCDGLYRACIKNRRKTCKYLVKLGAYRCYNCLFNYHQSF